MLTDDIGKIRTELREAYGGPAPRPLLLQADSECEEKFAVEWWNVPRDNYFWYCECKFTMTSEAAGYYFVGLIDIVLASIVDSSLDNLSGKIFEPFCIGGENVYGEYVYDRMLRPYFAMRGAAQLERALHLIDKHWGNQWNSSPANEFDEGWHTMVRWATSLNKEALK